MYDTCMGRGDELVRLDTALLELRRFIEVPSAARPGPTGRHGVDRVDFSTVLVVDAVARFDGVGDCSIGNVAEALHVAPSTASRFVGRAAHAGMLHRGRSTTDSRRTVLVLTPVGWRLQREAVGFRTGRLGALLSDWSASDVATFTRLLERFARCAHPSTEETS